MVPSNGFYCVSLFFEWVSGRLKRFQTAFKFLQIVFLRQNAAAAAHIGRRYHAGVFQRLHQVGGTVVAHAQLPLQRRDGGFT